MASKQSTVDFILNQIAEAGEISAKKMFGEYCIYCNGKVAALVCDDQLYVKPTLSGEDFIGECSEGCPYPGAKPCFLIAKEKWKDASWLAQLIKITATELPLPKKKRSKEK